ncbi:alpha/beta hydrolase [Saccharopolyspora indica]|uniref:alpha/beta fold hydrolase n=1 Tax=Saccharopolyspora indica TaxID=1229659 RepID=UPI0022EA985E|nr:alpha/beta fold hydrolase [Saccharopolyspora indica]MDA3649970.1 alpha/beta fold hydrolase [Saccharopolyspora indica]
MSTYVLVPGACHGGWWYDPIAAELRAAGHTVHAVTLTGLGPRESGAGVNLDTHIDDVVRLLESEDLNEVVLCGHSYAGMVITGVADRAPERIATLLHVDAFAPEGGDSAWSLTDGFWHDWYAGGAGRDGFAFAPLPVHEERAMPHPLGTVVQELRLTGAHLRVPRREYVYCTAFENSPFTPTYERLKDDPSWHVRALPVGHDLVQEAFDDFREILLDAAPETSRA